MQVCLAPKPYLFIRILAPCVYRYKSLHRCSRFWNQFRVGALLLARFAKAGNHGPINHEAHLRTQGFVCGSAVHPPRAKTTTEGQKPRVSAVEIPTSGKIGQKWGTLRFLASASHNNKNAPSVFSFAPSDSLLRGLLNF